MKFRGIIFAVDFDGTCVFHKYPDVGGTIPGAVDTLQWIRNQGGRIILNTMRSDAPGGMHLQAAIMWFHQNNIQLFSANVNPLQRKWTSSPKVDADYYIDDRALGAPLLYDQEAGFYMDWRNMRRILEAIMPEAVTAKG
jgi:hypothetical protein